MSNPQRLLMARTSEPAPETSAPVQAPAEIAFTAPLPEEMKRLADSLERSEAFQAAMANLRARVVNDWAGTQVEDQAKREHLWAKVKVIDEFADALGKLKMKGK